MEIVVILAVLAIIFAGYKILVEDSLLRKKRYHNRNKNKTGDMSDFKGILNRAILTPTELIFYKQLKRITDSHNLVIFPKVRIADIIQTRTKFSFYKISAQHIDYTICLKNSKPLMFVELDDKSHLNSKNKEKDKKKDYVFSTLGIKIFRVKVGEETNGLHEIDEILIKIIERYNSNIKKES